MTGERLQMNLNLFFQRLIYFKSRPSNKKIDPNTNHAT